jgi:hypothetical protein
MVLTVNGNISLTSVNQLIFGMVKCGVLFEVRSEFVNIVISSRVLFHDGSLLHSRLNTQLLITVHNTSRILTLV